MVPLPSVFSAAAAAAMPNPLMLQNALIQKLSPAGLAGRNLEQAKELGGDVPKLPMGALPPGFPPMAAGAPPQQWYNAMNYVNHLATQQLHMAGASAANGLLGGKYLSDFLKTHDFPHVCFRFSWLVVSV